MGNVLQKYFGEDEIKLAFCRVDKWSYSQIKDQIEIRHFKKRFNENCTHLSERIINGDYSPSRGFKFYMPKPSNTFRTQTQLLLEDALVYQAIANKLAEDVTDQLEIHKDQVFGSILRDECKLGTKLLSENNPDFNFFKEWKPLHKKFINAVMQSIEEDQSVYRLETDITGFFDSIPHYNLFKVLREDFHLEGEIIELLSECLNAWSGTRDGMTKGVGIPQGPAPSYLLANLFLHKLDSQLINKGLSYYRYMDDIKIYGFEKKKMQKLLHTIDKFTKSNGLSINSQKTSIDLMNLNDKEETLRSLKKLSMVSFNIDFLSEPFDQKDFQGYKKKMVDLLTDYNRVEDEIFEMIHESPDGNFSVKKNITDIDLIQQSVKFSETILSIQHIQKGFKPDNKLIPYWLFVLKTYFWRVRGFALTLALYGENDQIKEALISYYQEFEDYEWVRFYLITNLSFNQKFTQEELKDQILNYLRNEPDELPRVALYRLLVVHGTDKELRAEIERLLKNENSDHVKRVIADFKKYRIYDEFHEDILDQYFSL